MQFNQVTPFIGPRTYCEPCPAGYFKFVPTATTGVTAAGQLLAATNSSSDPVSLSNCVRCAPGSISFTGATSCTPCDVGTVPVRNGTLVSPGWVSISTLAPCASPPAGLLLSQCHACNNKPEHAHYVHSHFLSSPRAAHVWMDADASLTTRPVYRCAPVSAALECLSTVTP